MQTHINEDILKRLSCKELITKMKTPTMEILHIPGKIMIRRWDGNVKAFLQGNSVQMDEWNYFNGPMKIFTVGDLDHTLWPSKNLLRKLSSVKFVNCMFLQLPSSHHAGIFHHGICSRGLI